MLGANINHLMLSLIIGIVSLGVSFIGDMSKNLQVMSLSIQELNLRMGRVHEIMSDHEARLRSIESKPRR